YPETPNKVLDLILRYRAGGEEEKQKAYKELTKHGSAGYSALAKIASREENAQIKRDIYEEMAREITKETGDLLLEGKYATIEELLQLSLAGDRDTAYRNYAAFLLHRRQLNEKIADFKARAGKQDKKAAETLYYLCRAKSDLAGARLAAE